MDKKFRVLISILTSICFVSFLGYYINKDDTESISERDKRLTDKPIENFYEDDLTDNNSYWFVVSQSKGGGTIYNGFFKQNHNYFSVQEFKEESNGSYFVRSFTRVSKETYDNNVE